MSNVSMIDGHIDKTTNYERIKSMSIDEVRLKQNMKDRLIDLLINANVYDSYECKLCTKEDYCDYCNAEKLANYLIANGVIVQPCKVEDPE